MKVDYTKTGLPLQDLIILLKQRGLAITDELKAICYLTNIGYYRMSAYFYPLLKTPKTDHIYKDGATFDMALENIP
jgi:abortive infection bacteriophage resistance protein